jgi:hypothetical protein
MGIDMRMEGQTVMYDNSSDRRARIAAMLRMHEAPTSPGGWTEIGYYAEMTQWNLRSFRVRFTPPGSSYGIRTSAE